MALADAQNKLKELKAIADSPSFDIEKCKQLLKSLKVAVAMLPNAYPLINADLVNVDEALVAREANEYAAFIAIRNNDIDSFVRAYQQLKPFYFDFAKKLPVSERQYATIGLYLLYLLSEDRIGEFHVELERIPEAEKSNASNLLLQYPVLLEQCLAEGNYHRVIAAKSEAPLPMYRLFLDALVARVEVQQARASSISDGETELNRDDVQAVSFLGNYLAYATEIERIV